MEPAWCKQTIILPIKNNGDNLMAKFGHSIECISILYENFIIYVWRLTVGDWLIMDRDLAIFSGGDRDRPDYL